MRKIIALCFIAIWASSAVAQPPEWTVMVFMNGDNNLENDALLDFKEMAKVENSTEVNVLVQFDRSPGPPNEAGAWESCFRFKMEKGLEPLAKKAVMDLGEVNMGEGKVLKDFIKWCKQEYPAKHYMLILWDHGQGYRLRMLGDKPSRITRSVSDDDTSGDKLYNQETETALAEVEGVDLVGFDACLMGMVETAYGLRNVAPVMVGSEDLEPGSGWQYDDFLGHLVKNPAIDAQELGKQCVDSYERRYEKEDYATTLSAIDLTKVGSLADAVTGLSDRLRARLGEAVPEIKKAREDCKQYAEGYKFFHIDLSRFCERLAAQTSDDATRAAAVSVIDRLNQCVLLNYAHDPSSQELFGSGLAVYFPKDQKTYDTDPYEQGGYKKDNTVFPVAFVKDQHWADFLHDYWKELAQI